MNGYQTQRLGGCRLLAAQLLVGGSLIIASGCSNVDLTTAAPKADQALKAAFPDATLQKASREDKGLTKAYEATFVQEGRRIEVLVTQDGEILEVERQVPITDAPQPVADTIKKESKGAELLMLEKVENRGDRNKSDEPAVFYEAKWREWGLVREFKVAPDGSPL